jgi:16S rRNA (cytosine967-C5)-methyltransferase
MSESREAVAPRRSSPARRLAWRILQAVEQGGYADALLGSELARSRLRREDRALVARLVYGTLAWQAYLDHLLAGFSSIPLADLDPPIRVLLRMAMFQIVHLDRIPPFAAVATAVELAKSYQHGKVAAYVNAVLRRAAEGWRGVPLPARERDVAGHLSVRWSHPRWLVELWLNEYGAQETEALLTADNEPAPTALRVNVLRTTRDSLAAHWQPEWGAIRKGRYSPAALELSGGDPLAAPPYGRGEYTVQGEAAQLVSLLVAPRAGERILDACAAPGGKTTHLAELIGDRGEIVALDPNEKGVARIRAEAKRLGLKSIHAECADARCWRGDEGSFDRVLVDAPCSGLGTLRQHPEIRWRRKPEELDSFAALQLELLAACAARVRPGGVMVYATCTLTRAENECVVERFLARTPNFAVDDPPPDLPPSIGALIGPDRFLRTFPHRHGLDGFFAVRLRRSGSGDIVRA